MRQLRRETFAPRVCLRVLCLLLMAVETIGFAEHLYETAREKSVTGEWMHLLRMLSFERTSDSLYRQTLTTPFHLSQAMTIFTRNFFVTATDRNDNSNNNIIISPFSIHTALSMVFFGSPESSMTNKELSDTLMLDPNKYEQLAYNYLRLLSYYNRDDSNTQMELVNKIYLAQGFTPKQEFQDILTVFYRTSVASVDFAGNPSEATDIINEFVRGKTKGLIPTILSKSSVDSLTRMVLINAIYYKADWKYKFNKSQTVPMSFQKLGGEESITYPKGMRMEARMKCADFYQADARVLQIPYMNERFSMLVILPNKNDNEALEKIISNFNISAISERLEYYTLPAKIKIQMPSFEAEFGSSIKNILIQMGIKELFDENKADLGDISDDRLAVTDILHKAKVKVDEEGSEAAAATTAVIGVRSSTNKNFIVNRPFMFVIHDKVHDIPLFVGRIMNPADAG